MLLHFFISLSISYCSLDVHCSRQVQYMNCNGTAKTSLVAAFLFYNSCSILKDQFVLVMVTLGPGRA